MSDKKKYSVALPYHCSVFVEVEAENEEEAAEKAAEEASPWLCHQCSNGIELGELNESEDIDVVEI